jgi:uncharacterized RDD family membrane protein YckC
MRCPKCHYISFGSSDRCRNCGYEFVLAAEPPLPLDLPIQNGEAPIGPLGDFVLGEGSGGRRSSPSPAEVTGPAASGVSVASRLDLPLFGAGESADDAPLVTPTAVPRPPLSVRRGKPAIVRPSAERAVASEDESVPIARHLEGGRVAPVSRTTSLGAPAPDAIETAPVVARLVAGLIDLLVIGTIDGGVVYFTLLTLRLGELPLAEIRALPPVPLGVFLLLLNGGYLAIFTAAGGQTIGKMLTGIKVVTDGPALEAGADARGLRVSLGAAIVRAAAYVVSLLPAGVGLAAILFDSDGRALHDRLAETRVVKA